MAIETITKEQSVQFRNEIWKKSSNIPKWVNIEDVGLDRLFTNHDVLKKYYKFFVDFLINEGCNVNDYLFVEPSAGRGSFFELLPPKNRIGINLIPYSHEIIKAEFLEWSPPTNRKLVFIGNPPFGYRGWLALKFLNHISKYADYAGLILPMSFNSDGKGSPKHRVHGMSLVHSKIIPTNSFHQETGSSQKINALWQIWRKGENKLKNNKNCRNWIELFTVDFRKERLCGVKKLHRADYFLQRTYFNYQPKLVKSFSEVKYTCGYGIILKRDKQQIIDLLNTINWDNYSNLAAHNCRHISMYHIESVLVANGYCNV